MFKNQKMGGAPLTFPPFSHSEKRKKRRGETHSYTAIFVCVEKEVIASSLFYYLLSSDRACFDFTTGCVQWYELSDLL